MGVQVPQLSSSVKFNNRKVFPCAYMRLIQNWKSDKKTHGLVAWASTNSYF